jgi:hypothetical protein
MTLCSGLSKSSSEPTPTRLLNFRIEKIPSPFAQRGFVASVTISFID